MKLQKRAGSILLSLVMVFSLSANIPIEAAAAESVDYTERWWEDGEVKAATKQCTDYTTIGSGTTTLRNGWYVLKNSVNLSSSRINVVGDVHLILCDGATLTANKGINVGPDSSLNIYNQHHYLGEIYIHSDDEKDKNDGNADALIGGRSDAGDIIIHGGHFDLDPYYDFDNEECYKGAAIGGGKNGSARQIKIYDGLIDIDNNSCESAAIGGGSGASASRYSGEGIAIYGGIITLNASRGAGIGNGMNANGSTGSIAIYGGTVTAKSSLGAGIGGGENGGNGPVNIYGGKITAASTAREGGAGIGGGKNAAQKDPIRILGGTVVAMAVKGAGIGGGKEHDGGEIEIANANIIASSSGGGAGIGGGVEGSSENIHIHSGSVVCSFSTTTKSNQAYQDTLNKCVGNSKMVTDASTYAYGSVCALALLMDWFDPEYSGAAIGGGYLGDGGTITIEDSTVYAYCGKCAAAIGGGDKHGFDEITISGSKVYARNRPFDGSEDIFAGADSDTKERIKKVIDGQDAAAIGTGNKAESGGGTITIKNGSDVKAFAGTDAAGIGTGNEAKVTCTINITGSQVEAHGGRYGAGIGGGDNVSGGVINITDSRILMADSQTDGAGIGGGEDGSGGTINIKDSLVKANGGGYAAGIGGGDNASGGIITIDHSNLDVSGGTDGAGIGGGEDGHGGNITIKNDSDVHTSGGGYAAGIGGGDNGDGGIITISGSHVYAHGGIDGAGIGGGEDGDGGHIEILKNSYVEASGADCGSGIGGGEDASGDYCYIDYTSYAEVRTSGYGNVESIGHGDIGWYVLEDITSGSLLLGHGTTVRAGKDNSNLTKYTGNSRWNAIRSNNKLLIVDPCKHENCEWRSYDNIYHYWYCTDCQTRQDNYKRHTWDENYKCTVCGCPAETIDLTLKEKDNSGSVTRTLKAPKKWSYHLPEPENVPDGYEFVAWYETSQPGYFYLPGDGFEAAENLTLEALYMPVAETKYINDSGTECTVMARQLKNGDFPLFEGWYAVSEDIELHKKDFYSIQTGGNIHLIIPDGKTLRFVNDTDDPDIFYTMFEPTLTVYGQSGQTGVLDFGSCNEVNLPKIDQYGADIRISSEENNSLILESVIAGGSLKAGNCAFYDLTVSGGNVELASLWCKNQLVFGWTKKTDSIKITSIDRCAPPRIADGQMFTDDSGNIYSGTLTSEQWSTAVGKTLRPYIGHEYGEPEWVWDNKYTSATAVFRCTDCDDVKEVKAKVTYTDSGKNRTSTARCDFYGDAFTATQTHQVIFDVKTAVKGSGTVSADKTAARVNDHIELTVTPDENFALQKLYYTDEAGNVTFIEGESFVMPESSVTVTAEFVQVQETEYVSENGCIETVKAIPFTDETLTLEDDWYFISGETSITYHSIPISGDVRLILCDGAHMTRDNYSKLGLTDVTEGSSLTIYRAPGENVGKLDASYVDAESLVLIGGELAASETIETKKDLTVRGGSLSADRLLIHGDANFCGGEVSCKGSDTSALTGLSSINISGGTLDINNATAEKNISISGGSLMISSDIRTNSDTEITGGSVSVGGKLTSSNTKITGGNVAVDGTLLTYHDLTLGWTELSDSIYAAAYAKTENIYISGDQELTDGTTVYKGSYSGSEQDQFAGKTLTPNFLQHIERTEPYIDENGAYITGVTEHFALAGNNYAVNADGSMGQKLDSVEFSYFDFALLSDGTYQIKSYTGPMDGLTRLVIPKTYNGKAVTVLGNTDEVFMKGTGTQQEFTLVLTENVSTIQGMAFFWSLLTTVEGDTSGLCSIKDKAFVWANISNENKLTLNLSYPGEIAVDSGAFTDENMTVCLTHATTLSGDGGASSLTYVITDEAHPYGDPVWTWAEDHSSAEAKFTCTDSRCKHEETVPADITSKTEDGKIIYTASVTIGGKTYTDTKDLTCYSITVKDSSNGKVTADMDSACAGEKVTLTVTPDEGYKLSSLTVTGADGSGIEVTDNTFTMPAGNVTVSAEFALKTVNISVAGKGINGKNCSDILGDGTASYDFDTNTLTLTNADIKITNGNGIRYNESSTLPFNIVLNGRNRITEENGSTTTECFGIAMYAPSSQKSYMISGSGTLDIEISSSNPRVGILVKKALTIDGCAVSVKVSGSESDIGTDLWFTDTPLILKNGAHMTIRSDGIALQSNRNIKNLNVGGDCFFEAVSGTQAVNENINLTDSHPAVMVNTDAGAEGSSEWDGTAALTSYKYISMRGNDAPYRVYFEETQHGTAQADRYLSPEGGAVALSCTPGEGYELDRFTVYDDSGSEISVTDNSFTMPESDVHVSASFVPADGIGAKIIAHSVSLDGDIGVNFYMELSDSLLEHKDTAKMRFDLPDGCIAAEQEMLIKNARKVKSDGRTYYVFKCQVAAKEMTCGIKAQMIDGDRKGSVYTYSVKEYAYYLLTHTGDREDLAAAAPLVKAMVNYGAYSQLYFDLEPETLANEVLDDAEKELGSVTISIADPAVSGLPEGTVFEGATLSLRSETTLSLYFTGSTSLEFACGNYTVEKEVSGKYQIARIRGIKAKHIGNTFTLTVNSGAVGFSPLNYCKTALTLSTDSGDEEKDQQNRKLINVVKALYLYWQAADAYFPE